MCVCVCFSPSAVCTFVEKFGGADLSKAFPAWNVGDEGSAEWREQHPRKPAQGQCLHVTRHHDQKLRSKTWNGLETLQIVGAQLQQLVSQGHPLVCVYVDFDTMLRFKQAQLFPPVSQEILAGFVAGLLYDHQGSPSVRECHPCLPGGPVQCYPAPIFVRGATPPCIHRSV